MKEKKQKNKDIHIRLTESEYKKVKNRIKDSKMSQSEFTRKALLDYLPFQIDLKVVGDLLNSIEKLIPQNSKENGLTLFKELISAITPKKKTKKKETVKSNGNS